MLPILTVGAANAERLIEIDAVRLGQKHVVQPARVSAGGSAVNHACRLLAAGRAALPLIPLGDDEIGELVCGIILSAAQKGGIPQDAQRRLGHWLEEIVQTDCTTASTALLIERDGRRTVFSETGTAGERFGETCRSIMTKIAPGDVAGVVIGHIHGDASATVLPYGQSGQITSDVIARFAESVPVLANLGRSQYRLGAPRWLKELQTIGLFQLSFQEAKEFLATDEVASLDLMGIVRWFQEQGIPTVITLDRFGAIGILGNDTRLVVAWPYEIGDRLVDSTGAGDAMAAGLVSFVGKEGLGGRHLEGLCAALTSARLWAAYACTRLGGAADCPNEIELDAFASETSEYRKVEILSLENAEAFLWLLDKAFE